MTLDALKGPQYKELPVELLNREMIDEEGETLPGLDGQLVRISELEGQVFTCPKELIFPNPNQPRTYFVAKKMDELRATIVDMGQEEPIKVVPFLKDGVVRLAIIDGERRYRIIAELGDRDPIVQVKWEAQEIEVFIKSLIANESRADHNPVERARAYEKLVTYFIDKDGLNIGDAIKLVAQKLGISVPTIANHRRLLKLAPEVLEAVAQGLLPTQQALNIYTVQKKMGDDFDGVKLARAIVDNIDQDFEDGDADRKLLTDSGFGSRRGIKRDDVKNERRRQILDGAAGAEQQALAAANAVYKMDSGVSAARRKSELLMRAHRPSVVKFLKSRPATPPEAVRENIRNAIARLTEALEIVEEAIAPDALPEVPGKPSFASQISRHGKVFHTPLRAKIAAELAKASDSVKPLVYSGNELAKALGIVPNSIGPSIRELGPGLETIGLKIEQHVKREKLADAWVKNAAFRLAWIDDQPVDVTGDEIRHELKSDEEMKIFYDQKGRTLTAGDRRIVKKGAGFGLVIDMIPAENPEMVLVSVNGSFVPEILDGGQNYTFAQWVVDIGRAGMKVEIESAEGDE